MIDCRNTVGTHDSLAAHLPRRRFEGLDQREAKLGRAGAEVLEAHLDALREAALARRLDAAAR